MPDKHTKNNDIDNFPVDIDVQVIPDEDNKIIELCMTDSECGETRICVLRKCVNGCTTDSDCAAYKGTRCNTKLGRCLNVSASAQACGEAKCAIGCCYSAKGFTELACLKPADIKTCGLCKQGEVYMDGKTCVPAACDSSLDKCSNYNSTEPAAPCFQCKPGELICYLNQASCSLGSAILIESAKCIPAGEACSSDGASCCSGQPCIQGYCY